MGRILGNQTYRDILLGTGLICSVFALIYWPQEGTAAAVRGLQLCYNVIIPSLFPFFVLSSLVVELGLSRYLGRLLEGVMAPLFRVGGNCASALALGFVGGYPVGASTAISLYKNGQCSKTEAERLLAFCNNAGPAFILGVVGTGIFSSSKAGLLLYFAHISASLIVGILFRFYKANEGVTNCRNAPPFHSASFPVAFTRSVTGALQSTLNICAFIIFFTVIIHILFISGIMGQVSALLSPTSLSQPWVEQLLIGGIEMSSGVSSLTASGDTSSRLSMAAFMLGWAGLSVHCQVLAFLGDCGLSMKTYFVGKLLHGGISAAITALLLHFFPLSDPVSFYLTEQVEVLASLDFQRTLTISFASVFILWLSFILLALYAIQKSSGKLKRKGV